MSTWTGTSHARMTRSMRSLPGGTYKVLATLRRLIPDGARRKVSHDMISRVAQVSESTVSAAMDKLDGAFIIRHYLGKGRGNGYEIEMLPPPEQRPVTPRKGSISDPSQRSFFSGITMPQEAENKGSDIDPSIIYDQDHKQQQQRASQFTQTCTINASDQGVPTLPEATLTALTAAGAHPKLIRRIAEAKPACTPEDVAAALASATAKPGVHTPPGLALECLAQNQLVIAPRAVSAAPEGQPRRRRNDDDRVTPEDFRALKAVYEQPEPDEEAAPDADEAAPDDLSDLDDLDAPPVADEQVNRRQLWQYTLDQLQAQVTPQEFDTWLRWATLRELDQANRLATVVAGSPRYADGLRQRYALPMRRALSDALGYPVQLVVEAD